MQSIHWDFLLIKWMIEEKRKARWGRVCSASIYTNFIYFSLEIVHSSLVILPDDKQEKERVDARNALEEYVYELRNKLSSHEELALYATEAVRENLIKTLDQMETWLYEEGEDCQKQIYKDKLNDLKIQGDPIEKRRIEYERLPVMIEEFRRVLQVKSKAVTAVATKDPKYAHLTEADLVQLQQAMDRYWQYVNKCSGFLNNPQRDKDPQIKIADVEKEFNNFQSAVEPILNKSPPKASPPKDAQSNDAQSSDQKNAENQNQQDASQNHHSNQQQNEDNMDVDWIINRIF